MPEYYLTRTELSILRNCAGELARRVGKEHIVVELGCGASDKARVLLRALQPLVYVPIDISRASLLDCAAALREEYPAMEVHAICADYTRRVTMPPAIAAARRLVFFPGSTLGNFEPLDAQLFLRDLRALVGTDGALVVGVDHKKDHGMLQRAYNDSQGVTAAFNLNLLVRIRRELDAKLSITGFRHDAYYNEKMGRIEMHLISRRRQDIEIDGHCFRFGEGDGICTEYSYKYDSEEFRRLAGRAGYACEKFWTDPSELFGVYLFRPLARSTAA